MQLVIDHIPSLVRGMNIVVCEWYGVHRSILTGVLEGNNVVGGTHATYEPLLIDVNTMFFGFDLL